jgi:FtsZ-binding cell division protein ZapB
MPSPDDYIPQSVQIAISAVLGAGGLAWFRAYMENKRLGKKEFRELLVDRIRELEVVVDSMQKRMGNLRVEMAHLEAANKQLQRERSAWQNRHDNERGAWENRHDKERTAWENRHDTERPDGGRDDNERPDGGRDEQSS